MSTIVVLEQFGRVRRQINRLCIVYLKEVGIGPRQMVLLRYVHKHKKCSMSAIALGVGSDNASVTRMVNALVKSRHLQRVASKSDQRHSWVRLGVKSKKIIPKIDRIYARVSKDFIGALPQREQKALLRMLSKVQPALERAISSALGSGSKRAKKTKAP